MTTETFVEFTFEAAHALPPFAPLHGHSFKAALYLRGDPDPVYGWSHNLYEVEKVIAEVKQSVDHRYLNDFIEAPSIENVSRWLWSQFEPRIPGLDRLTLSRGRDGSAEGCTCTRAERVAAQAA